jgi:hypothetical protein
MQVINENSDLHGAPSTLERAQMLLRSDCACFLKNKIHTGTVSSDHPNSCKNLFFQGFLPPEACGIAGCPRVCHGEISGTTTCPVTPPGHDFYDMDRMTRMHDTAAAGGGLARGRRPAAGALKSGATREEDGPPAGQHGDSEYITGAGPDLRGPAQTGRLDGLRQGRRQTTRAHRPPARAGRTAGAGRDAGADPRSRNDSYGYTSLYNESQPLGRPAPGDQLELEAVDEVSPAAAFPSRKTPIRTSRCPDRSSPVSFLPKIPGWMLTAMPTLHTDTEAAYGVTAFRPFPRHSRPP